MYWLRLSLEGIRILRMTRSSYILVGVWWDSTISCIFVTLFVYYSTIMEFPSMMFDCHNNCSTRFRIPKKLSSLTMK